MRCTIKDKDRINDIFTDISVWDSISDDGCDDDIKTKIAETFLYNPNVYILNPMPNAVFVLIPQNAITYEVHTAIKQESRGRVGFKAGRDAIKWMFENTGCQKLISWVPEFNRSALVFASMNGFDIEGTSKKSFLKNGELFDQILVGLTKGGWLCQQQH